MSRRELLVPIVYEYRGRWDIHVYYADDGSMRFSASDFQGYFLDLKRLEKVYVETSYTHSEDLDDLLLQIDLYENKVGIGSLYAR